VVLILLALLIKGGVMSREIHVQDKKYIAQCKIESEGLVLELWNGDIKIKTNYLYWNEMGLKPPKEHPELQKGQS
jgi:hypothetical protein